MLTNVIINTLIQREIKKEKKKKEPKINLIEALHLIHWWQNVQK